MLHNLQSILELYFIIKEIRIYTFYFIGSNC